MPRKLPRIVRTPPREDAQLELFVPDLVDIPLKDGQSLMTLPVLHIGDYKGRTKPVTRLEYASEKGTCTVTGEYGIATIRDYDLLIFAISHLVDAMNRDEPVSRYFGCSAYTFLKFARRGDGRKQYEGLQESLRRLKTTNIETTFIKSDVEKTTGMSWINDYTFERDTKTGQVTELLFEIPKWVYEPVVEKGKFLTLSHDYFLLVPMMRWLYRVMRKSAGQQLQGWRYSIDELYRLSGSQNEKRKWKSHLRQLLRSTHPEWLDYLTCFHTESNGTEMLYFIHVDSFCTLHERIKDNPFDARLHDWQRHWVSEETLSHVLQNHRHPRITETLRRSASYEDLLERRLIEE